MTTNEIKKAFELFKKELKSECGLCGGFTMSKRQIELGTATYLVDATSSYEWEIESAMKDDAKVQAYDTWKEEEKAKHHEYCLERIERLKAYKEQYGTKENKLQVVKKQIEESKTFEKLESTIGEILLSTEEKENCYYIRFHY